MGQLAIVNTISNAPINCFMIVGIANRLMSNDVDIAFDGYSVSCFARRMMDQNCTWQFPKTTAG